MHLKYHLQKWRDRNWNLWQCENTRVRTYYLNLVFQCNFNAEKWENTFSPWCSHPVRGSNFCHFIFTDGALNALPYFSLNTSAFEKIAKWNFNIFILIYFFIKKNIIENNNLIYVLPALFIIITRQNVNETTRDTWIDG